jgi:hypothetical protein
MNANVPQEPIVCSTATIQELQNAIQNKLPIAGITHVVTHPKFHLDEASAAYLIMRTPEGKKLFPGANEGTLCSTSQKDLFQQDFVGEDGFYALLQKGLLVIGTGGGPFDEHTDRVKRKSCVSVVADYLGLFSKPEGFIYRRLINYINFEDRNGVDLSNETVRALATGNFSNSLKDSWKLVDAEIITIEELVGMAFKYIFVQIESQRLFMQSRENFKKLTPQVIEVPFLKTKECTKSPVMLVIESDDPGVVAAARFVWKTHQTMVVKPILSINSKGQFYFSGSKDMDVIDVVRGLRVLLGCKKRIRVPRWQDLVQDGTIKGLEEIYFHTEGHSIMNGSITQDDATGMIGSYGISKQDVINVVLESLNPKFFTKHEKSCEKGICPVKENKDARCPFFLCGYTRCHEVQRKMPVTRRESVKN